MTGSHFAAAVVAAQVLVQIGAFTLPALLPGFISRWALSATEAGWLIGAFFAAYVASVPVLVALTDRIAARRIYLLGSGLTALSHLGFALLADGFWPGLILRAIAGAGWAGCYMPGLKAISDRLEGAAQSRAVSWHAAGVGIAGALSFLVAGTADAIGGPQAAFAFAAACALLGFLIGFFVLPTMRPEGADVSRAALLLDLRPVLRNRRAMAWIIGYTVHTWELAALRAWGVTFLAALVARDGAPAWLPGPSTLFTAAGLVGIAASVAGNESAEHLGRARIVAIAMAAGALLAPVTGASWLLSVPFAAVCVVIWNASIYLDSSALTAGTVQAAEKERRGATMGLHSMCGYAGGFIGPIGVGAALDLVGAEHAWAWLLAFGHLAPVTLIGFWLLRRMGRWGS